MGMFSRNINTLAGLEIVGIDVEDGKVYFEVIDPRAEQRLEYVIQADFLHNPHFIVDIEGDLADLIDCTILSADYDYIMMCYCIQSELGTVFLSADGPDTSFEAC